MDFGTSNAELAEEAPEWVKPELLREAWERETWGRKAMKDEARVSLGAITTTAAAAPGDGYCSSLWRLTAQLNYEDDSVRNKDGDRSKQSTYSVIIKGPPLNPLANAAVCEGKHFLRESTMLVNCIPAMNPYLKMVGCTGPLEARCLLEKSEPIPILVMEDLVPQGFRLADCQRGLDLSHCLLAIRKLARYHAASHFFLVRNRNGSVPQLKNPMRPAQGRGTFPTFVDSFLRLSAAACHSWQGFEGYAAVLEAFRPLALETFAKLFDKRPNIFQVIVHGDFWAKNLMFYYENDEPTNVRIIDFQISCVASPAVDLVYFLSTSPREGLWLHHESLLLREYHETLSEAIGVLNGNSCNYDAENEFDDDEVNVSHAANTSETLGCTASATRGFFTPAGFKRYTASVPPLEEIKAAMEEHGPLALFGALGVAPLARASPAAAAGLDIDATADAARADAAGARVYKDPAVERWLRHMIPLLERRGWLPHMCTNVHTVTKMCCRTKV